MVMEGFLGRDSDPSKWVQEKYGVDPNGPARQSLPAKDSVRVGLEAMT